MTSSIIINSISDSSGIGYTPEQIVRAYDLNNSFTGKNISVAVIDFIGNPYIERNLIRFSEEFGLKKPTLEIIGNTYNSSFDFSAYIEPTVDSQWVHAVSQDALIYIIKAPSYTIEGAISAINTAKEVRSDIVLLSFQANMNQMLLENSSIFDYDGIFVASAGDFGAQANFPACVPYCVAVGGTSLDISEDGRRLSEETVWEGTGGGICDYYDIPNYQSRMSGISEITNGRRGVPDVSFLASPEPGFSVYHSSSYGSFGWYSVGGTSISASCVAGILANMLSRNINGLNRRNIHEVIYELAGGNTYKNEYSMFIDIIKGNNGTFSAKQGYDLCTGLGSLYSL